MNHWNRFWFVLFMATSMFFMTNAQQVTETEEATVKKRSGVNEQDVTKPVDHDQNEPAINDTIEDRKDQTKTKSRQMPIDNRNKNKKSRKNTELLHKVGLTKIKTPVINHHRKRLASQSRKAQPGDSHMFVIKLPPNPYYYTHSKPIAPNKFDEVKQSPPSAGLAMNKVGLDFNSNGKPSRIYHWNIPVMKKMMIARKTNGDKAKAGTLWDPISEQSTIDSDDDFVHHKVSYYRPKKPSKKTFNKYFAGNGKPHSLYVIDKSKKPVSYHRLMP